MSCRLDIGKISQISGFCVQGGKYSPDLVFLVISILLFGTGLDHFDGTLDVNPLTYDQMQLVHALSGEIRQPYIKLLSSNVTRQPQN